MLDGLDHVQFQVELFLLLLKHLCLFLLRPLIRVHVMTVADKGAIRSRHVTFHETAGLYDFKRITKFSPYHGFLDNRSGTWKRTA